MKVAIDISQTAFHGSGVARYTQLLAESLLEQSAKTISDTTYTFLFSSLRQRTPSSLISRIRPPHSLKRLYIPPTLLSILWNDLHILPVENIIGDQDVYVSSDWTQPPLKKARSITIVHDLIPYLYPETSTQNTDFSFKKLRIKPNIVKTHTKRLSHVAQECDLIIADSHSTKADCISCLNIPESRIRVVYPAIEILQPTLQQRTHVRQTYSRNRPYFISVGKLEPRKNIPALIQAFDKSGLSATHDLVIIGSTGWGNVQDQLPPLSDSTQKALAWLGYVSDEDLFALYAEADLCVMPSLYEGFGFPILEAMAVGCPVACSSTSSLGELGKGYAVLFDPLSVDSIAQALLHVEKSVREKTIDTRKAQEYALSFTKDRFAREIESCIDHVYTIRK